MQKKIIALAVAAAASSAAFAQTNVQIYGVMDVGQAYVKSSGATANAQGVGSFNNAPMVTGTGVNQGSVGRLDTNASYIGFKGTEDLGNGLKALFQFETHINGDVGGWDSARDTFVGVTGGFGTVVAGNLTHPLRAMGAKVELLPGAAGFGATMALTGTINGTKTGADQRASNAVAYVSPNFGGFTGTVAYVNGENRKNATTTVNEVNQKQYQVAAQYENGPLWVAAGYHKAVDTGVTALAGTTATLGASGGDDARIYRLAAAYTLPTNTKLTALYDNTKVDIIKSLNDGSVKRTAWSLGVAQSFGKNTVGLEYARSSKLDLSNNGVSGKVGDSGSSMWTALYAYELSKRTTVHARYSRLSNQAAASNNFYVNSVANGETAGPGADFTGYMVGLRHAF